MRGKLGEDLKVVVLHRAQQLRNTTVTFGAILDTKDYDEAMIVLNIGKAFGTSTLGAVLYESNAKNVTSMAPVTLGAFDAISISNHQTTYAANIKAKNYKRYLTLRCVVGGMEADGATLAEDGVGYSATAILGKPDSTPVESQTLQFNLGN